MIEAILIINRAESRCSACGRNADPFEDAHLGGSLPGDGCGAVYVGIGTMYPEQDGYWAGCREMRPDLPFVGYPTATGPHQRAA